MDCAPSGSTPTTRAREPDSLAAAATPEMHARCRRDAREMWRGVREI